MKKQNNRFRNNNGNNGYTLNYKFDSVSIAGKISGTALDLIRRYNDLAKEAQSGGNYVDMEIYRQYAEHYRKIVTDINERRQARQDFANSQAQSGENNPEPENSENSSAELETPVEEKPAPVEPVAEANGYVETLAALPENPAPKTFQVVEIGEEKDKVIEDAKPKRIVRRRAPSVRKKAVEA